MEFLKKSFVAAGILVAVLLSGCSKDSGCKPVPVENEKAQLVAFNAAKGIDGILHSTGFYYQILASGSSNRPQQSSQVFVKYKGTFLDGTVFDEQTNPGLTGFVLTNLIDGWKFAIPMIGKGGRIYITVPSALAYGCQGESRGSTAIPPNTPLYFEIDLVDFY